MIEYVNTRDMYTLMRMETHHRKPFRSISKSLKDAFKMLNACYLCETLNLSLSICHVTVRYLLAFTKKKNQRTELLCGYELTYLPKRGQKILDPLMLKIKNAGFIFRDFLIFYKFSWYN